MSDFIREVDEEVRRDRIAKLWADYGLYLVGAALLLVALVAAWRGWEWYETRAAASAGARFEEALKLLSEGRRFEGEVALNEIARDGTAGYRLLARFRAAAEAGKSDAASGAAAYDAIANDTSVEQALRDLARVHAALLLVDRATPTDIAARMEPLMAPKATFRHSAREIVALARYRAGEAEAAGKLYLEILGDPETPPAMRDRAQAVLAVIGGSGRAVSPGTPATQ